MRLTEKGNECYYPARKPNGHLVDHYESDQKLGQLEDIEEELGIDLITLAKGMKDGIYVKQGEKILKKELKEIQYSNGMTVHWESDGKQYDKKGALVILYGDYDSQYCDFNNVYTYGRDWALTREELQ